jgi:penicillin-binding protein 1A
MASDPAAAEPVHLRIRREASGAWAWYREAFRRRRRVRWLTYGVGALLVLWLVVWLTLARNLPDAKMLLSYEPPLPTVVRGIDGEIVHTYARERRVQLQYKDFPPQLVNAYTSAEDETFWTHGGIDVGGLAGAVIDYANPLRTRRAKGGSTITQQVAKNILINNEYSVTRKLKEMILARRIEGVLDKRQIMELYLNEIPLGRRSFGVQAAARAYFNKDVGDLALQEMAFLAILPKAPETYSRAKFADEALARRNHVLDVMVKDGHVSEADAAAAKAMPLGLQPQQPEAKSADAGYFLEEVRRQLIAKYGEQAEAGPHSVYAGGLWVRTSLDPQLQTAAQNALRAGLVRYGGTTWSKPVGWLDPGKGSLKSQLAGSNLSINYQNWRIAVVLERSGPSARIGFADGTEGALTGVPDALKVGDVTAVAPAAGGWAIRAVPVVSGGFLVEQPYSGRVMAMQGGFDDRLASFNRATQAERQPGSTIKPFVYATALDYGMTPATMVPDSQFCVYQGANLGQKCFRNFGGEGGSGEHTMRWGLEQSRNLMTVHIASDTGMENVTRTFKRVGIGNYGNYLSYALGAGDTTVARMVNAYTALFNHGVQHQQSVIDYVEDRHGKVIWRADTRPCTGCNMEQWDGKPMPRLPERGRQVLDARTAYQVIHMMEGVVQRGTAVVLRDVGIPLAGKTGTTNGPTNVWFVGGNSDIIGGIYVGYDQPRNLGGWAQGGRIAAPIFKQFIQETRPKWSSRPFLAPPGVRMVRIDRRSGTRVFDAWPTDDAQAAVIWEAFKPDTEPKRENQHNPADQVRDLILAQLRRGQASAPGQARAAPREQDGADFVEEQGGLY